MQGSRADMQTAAILPGLLSHVLLLCLVIQAQSLTCFGSLRLMAPTALIEATRSILEIGLIIHEIAPSLIDVAGSRSLLLSVRLSLLADFG